jgi:hypothetical protein
MNKNIALYKFNDSILKELVEYQIIEEICPDFDIIVYLDDTQHDVNELSKNCGEGKLYELYQFIDNILTEEEQEKYYFKKFCIEQKLNFKHINQQDKEDWFKQSGVSTCKQLFKQFVTVCTCNVYCVDTDEIFENNPIYRKAITKVYNTDNWNNGDIIVVKKALNTLNNKGKFIYYDYRIHELETTKDCSGHINTEFPAILEFPICFWASKFECDNKYHDVINNNSLILVSVSSDNYKHIMTCRKSIIDRIMNKDEHFDVLDRLIVFNENNTKYAIICEFGIDNQNIEKCNKLIKSDCKNCFYMQYPRFLNSIVKENNYIVSKSKFINNLEINKNKSYAKILQKILELNIAPNNFGFIDCGEL